MNKEEKNKTETKTKERERLTVAWDDPGITGRDTGFQSRQMMGSAESGCCRQGGSPCGAKKW